VGVPGLRPPEDEGKFNWAVKESKEAGCCGCGGGGEEEVGVAGCNVIRGNGGEVGAPPPPAPAAAPAAAAVGSLMVVMLPN